jgi:hypothetical protein
VSLDLLPLVAFDRIGNEEADRLLKEWGHWLGGCNRPFGRQSFGLQVADLGLIAVAVSASTVNETCAGWPRREVVELARLASHPEYRWATRVALRLWREVAPACWAAQYWPVRACVSYANTARGHTGQVYRMDGWRKVAEVRGGTAGGSWTRGKRYDPKTVWAWEVPA